MDNASNGRFMGASEKPSFVIRLTNERHTSWQGEIQWLESGAVRQFRSALELLVLIQAAMDSTTRTDASIPIRRWDPEENTRRNKAFR